MQKQTKLSNVLFAVLFIVILVVTAIVFAVTTQINYTSYEQQAENELKTEVEELTIILNSGTSIEDASKFDISQARCTLVSSDGTVVFDSEVPISSLENHNNRQEIIDARSGSITSIHRYSETTGIDAIYAAKELENGSVIRLSEERLSYAAYLSPSATTLIIFFVVTILAAFLISRVLTRIIIKPLRSINLDKPQESKTYEEIEPLLEKFRDQNSFRREFTSNVSHEMKTPLQVIGGYAELIQEGIVPKKEIPKTARLIRKESEHMRALIDDVLTLSKLDEDAISGNDDIVLSATCKYVINRLEKAAKKKEITVLTSLDKDFTIHGSSSLADQMVYNLLDNAIKYSDKGSTVKISLHDSKLMVCDEGPGIPKDQRERIFERFYRVDESHSRETGGTGLGLAIVKHAVESFGGTIAVEDNPDGRGTAFVVTF